MGGYGLRRGPADHSPRSCAAGLSLVGIWTRWTASDPCGGLHREDPAIPAVELKHYLIGGQYQGQGITVTEINTAAGWGIRTG